VTVGRAARFTYAVSGPTSVTFALRRSLGRGRYAKARTVMTANAAAGENTLTLGARRLGRRAGLYRLTAAPPEGAAQVVQFRIKRRG
jgi:hypothetical protein